MPKLTRAEVIAATTHEDEIEAGTPEEAYQAINRAKMLWGFRLRDVESWQEVIERWNHEPKAWDRIPSEEHPYGSPRRMIEAELDTNYDQFKDFVIAVLGELYAALIDEPLAKRGGNRNPWGRKGKPENQTYLGKFDLEKKPNGGNSTAFLRQQIQKKHPEALSEIGKGKTYGSVKAAARQLGIRTEKDRYSLPADPEAAAIYLAKHFDRTWFEQMSDAYYKAQG